MHLHVEPPSGRAVNGAVELVAERDVIPAESTESVRAREGGESIRQELAGSSLRPATEHSF